MASPQTAVPIMAVGPVLKLPGMTATLPTRLAARAKTGTRGRRPLIDETARPSPTCDPGRTCSPHGHGSDRATTSPLAGVWTVAGA